VSLGSFIAHTVGWIVLGISLYRLGARRAERERHAEWRRTQRRGIGWSDVE
jgi:hypothetical protein